ncbi:MAG: hypothetical protein H7A21_08540 [Spirochaetales bacterium]|nr:hypothetical protein [Leptospiraceae bacterium]MCP5481464.1 hypothetical protein [Spirochaetales bacterium]MCP5484293.1 hypothetical protein [Spirochaetales bacterium]
MNFPLDPERFPILSHWPSERLERTLRGMANYYFPGEAITDANLSSMATMFEHELEMEQGATDTG